MKVTAWRVTPNFVTEISGCNSKQWQTWISMHPEKSVAKLGVPRHAVTVIIYDLHHLNILSCYHLLEIISLFGSHTLWYVLQKHIQLNRMFDILSGNQFVLVWQPDKLWQGGYFQQLKMYWFMKSMQFEKFI